MNKKVDGYFAIFLVICGFFFFILMKEVSIFLPSESCFVILFAPHNSAWNVSEDKWIPRAPSFAPGNLFLKQHIFYYPKEPWYILDGNFPREQIETFNNFLLFCDSTKRDHFYLPSSINHVRYPHHFIIRRLRFNSPIKYEDFLATVSMLFSYVLYDQFFAIPARNTFLIENIVEPLSHDLKVKEYGGYHFSEGNLPEFFRKTAIQSYYELDRFYKDIDMGMAGQHLVGNQCRIIDLANRYALTFWCLSEGRLYDAYSSMYNSSRNLYNVIWGIEGVLKLERPYYFFSDAERYEWFLFFQRELRQNGYEKYANKFFETELDHYRELIVWQLQERAYLNRQLYENGDAVSLLTLKDLLAVEWKSLRKDVSLKQGLREAMDDLNNADIEACSDLSKSVIVLPWIDRKEIDQRQGLLNPADFIPPTHSSAKQTSEQRLWEWRTEREKIDDTTLKKMEEAYEWSICYLRLLATAIQKLYSAKNLESITYLHSYLVTNENVNYMESDLFFLRRPLVKGAFDSQTLLNQRRYNIIQEDFWAHQQRRRDGDMAVGEITLPWVKIQGKEFVLEF